MIWTPVLWALSLVFSIAPQGVDAAVSPAQERQFNFVVTRINESSGGEVRVGIEISASESFECEGAELVFRRAADVNEEVEVGTTGMLAPQCNSYRDGRVDVVVQWKFYQRVAQAEGRVHLHDLPRRLPLVLLC